MNSNKIDFDYEIELIKKAEELNKDNKASLYREIVEKTSYKKGEKKKEVFKLPMPTHKSFLSSKQVNAKTYGALILNSNWGGTFLNPDDRFIYKEKFDTTIKQIALELNMSERTIKRHIAKLEKCDIKAIELNNINNQLVYKLNYGVFNEDTMQLEKYVTLTNIALRKLTNAYSEYALRIYLFLLYKCYKEAKQIKQSEICEAIGISESSRKIVTDCVDALVSGGFISVMVDYVITDRISNGRRVEHTIRNYYYSLSDEYLVHHLEKKI